jgi:hypothetical protein
MEFEPEPSKQSMELEKHGVFGPSHDSSQEAEDPNALIDSIARYPHKCKPGLTARSFSSILLYHHLQGP